MKNIATVSNNNQLDVELGAISYNKVCSNIRKLECPYEYQVTTKSTRLDMISQELYESTQYDWILSLVNGLQSTECTRGTILHYPNKSVLEKFLNEYGNS